ncbi:DUF2130 domain-containing protein, partial [Pseudomonas aeruginosa]|nr:DUF2130 domain-containing protein [Pseudomonas aeruginosa]
ALAQALSSVEKERDVLANEIAQIRKDNQAALHLAEARLANELQKSAVAKDTEIQELKARLQSAEVASKLAINEAVTMVA